MSTIPTFIDYGASGNFGSTEVMLREWNITIPAGCKKLLCLGSMRLQGQSPSATDITGVLDYGHTEAATPTYKGYQRGNERTVTSVNTFNGSNMPFIEEFDVTPGVHKMRFLGRTNSPAANGSQFYCTFIPLAG